MLTNSEIDHALDGFIHTWMNARQDHAIQMTRVEWLRHITFGNPEMLSDPSRFNEFLTPHSAPRENIELIRATIGTAPHWLTVLTNDPAHTIRDYQALGYGFISDEFLMRLPNLQTHLRRANAEIPVTRVQTVAETRWVNQYLGKYAVDPTRLDDPSIAYCFIRRHELPAAFGRVAMSDGIAGPDTIRTRAEFQRRGLGFELMNALHRKAVARGCTESILLSSLEGRALYHKLGYADVRQAVVFVSGQT